MQRNSVKHASFLQCLAKVIRDILDLMMQALEVLLMGAEGVVDRLNGILGGR